MSTSADNARIEQLEAELAELRARRGDSEAAAGEHGRAAGATEPRLAGLRLAGRTQTILLGTAIIAISLGFFIAIYTALSTGFNSLADKAASSYATDFTEEDRDGDHAPPEQTKRPARPAPAVPGL